MISPNNVVTSERSLLVTQLQPVSQVATFKEQQALQEQAAVQGLSGLAILWMYFHER
jgi:hypothetical protein